MGARWMGFYRITWAITNNIDAPHPLCYTFFDVGRVSHAGGMAEWTMAPVLKTGKRKLRGFESLSLRH
jgi:hypothetical protein